MALALGDVNPSILAGAAVLLAWGLLDCFFGYRIFRVAVALLGAVVLGLFATSAVAQWVGGNEVLFWAALIVGALLGLTLSFAFYLVGVFLAGFSFGYVLAIGLVPVTGPGVTLLVGAVAGAVCGLLAMLLQRLFVTAATAFSGSFRVALALAFFIDGIDWRPFVRNPDQIPSLFVGRWWVPLLMLGLGLFGFLVQLRSTPAGKKTDR